LLFSHLPPPDAEMKAAGLEGRYFPSVGNHEVWDDPQIEGVLSEMQGYITDLQSTKKATVSEQSYSLNHSR